jgi:hypothetical protein
MPAWFDVHQPHRHSATMKASHFPSQSWALGSTATHSSFSDVHQHLDDASHLFEEMNQNSQTVTGQKATLPERSKAKVLFKFFDGWPMSES